MRAVGGRLTELRAEGHEIETKPLGGGLFRFFLRNGPCQPKPGEPGYLASLVPVASITGRRAKPPTDDTPAPGCLF